GGVAAGAGGLRRRQGLPPAGPGAQPVAAGAAEAGDAAVVLAAGRLAGHARTGRAVLGRRGPRPPGRGSQPTRGGRHRRLGETKDDTLRPRLERILVPAEARMVSVPVVLNLPEPPAAPPPPPSWGDWLAGWAAAARPWLPLAFWAWV